MKKAMTLLRRLLGSGFSGLVDAVNIAEGVHEGGLTKKVDAALSVRNLLLKVGTDNDHVDICGASDRPRGVCNDEAGAAEEYVNVLPLGASPRTVLVVASEAIADDADVYTAAAGKVQNLPVASGTYYRVGHTLAAAAADGDDVEIEPCFPEALVVA